MYLQKNIAFLRDHHRLTYEAFAAEIGATAGKAKSYELQGITPNLETLCAIADYAGITLDALVRQELTVDLYAEARRSQGGSVIKDLQKQISDLATRLARLEKAAKSKAVHH